MLACDERTNKLPICWDIWPKTAANFGKSNFVWESFAKVCNKYAFNTVSSVRRLLVQCCSCCSCCSINKLSIRHVAGNHLCSECEEVEEVEEETEGIAEGEREAAVSFINKQSSEAASSNRPHAICSMQHVACNFQQPNAAKTHPGQS